MNTNLISPLTWLLFALLLLLPLSCFGQKCSESIVPTTPNDYFIINQNGTVTDKRTGLVWTQCAIGQQSQNGDCVGQAKFFTFNEARKHGHKLNIDKFTEWRLPTLTELSAIVELSCNTPAINTSVFPATESSSYWTNSRFVNKLKHHWLIQFRFGGNHVDKDSTLGLARFVHEAVGFSIIKQNSN